MTIRRKKHGKVMALARAGKILGVGADPEMMQAKIKASIAADFRDIVMDLQDIPYHNSWGVGFLVSAQATRTGRQVTFTGTDPLPRGNISWINFIVFTHSESLAADRLGTLQIINRTQPVPGSSAPLTLDSPMHLPPSRPSLPG